MPPPVSPKCQGFADALAQRETELRNARAATEELRKRTKPGGGTGKEDVEVPDPPTQGELAPFLQAEARAESRRAQAFADLERCKNQFPFALSDVRFNGETVVISGTGGVVVEGRSLMASVPGAGRVDLLQQVGDLRAQANRLEAQINGLSAKLDSQIAGLNAKVDAPDRVIAGKLTVNGLTTLKNVELGVLQVNDDFIAIGRVLLSKPPGLLDETLSDMDERIEQLALHIHEGGLAVSLGRAFEAIDQIRAELDLEPPSEGGPIPVSNRVSLKGRVEKLDERVKKVEQKVGLVPTPPGIGTGGQKAPGGAPFVDQ